MGIKTKEQRKHHRDDCQVPVDGKGGSSLDKIRAVDICENGLGIVTPRSLKVNSEIPIELELSQQDIDPVVVMGQVKWVSKVADTGLYRVGFRFSHTVVRGAKTRIKQYFQKKA